MNGWGPSREVEKPKGKRAMRAERAAKALKLSYHLDTDASALQHVTLAATSCVIYGRRPTCCGRWPNERL
jgi:hypothetical protein